MKIIKDIAISETGFIFNPVTGESFRVNETGYLILNKLKEGASQDEILKALKSEFDASEDELEQDLNDFLSMLERFNLLVN